MLRLCVSWSPAEARRLTIPCLCYAVADRAVCAKQQCERHLAIGLGSHRLLCQSGHAGSAQQQPVGQHPYHLGGVHLLCIPGRCVSFCLHAVPTCTCYMLSYMLLLHLCITCRCFCYMLLLCLCISGACVSFCLHAFLHTLATPLPPLQMCKLLPICCSYMLSYMHLLHFLQPWLMCKLLPTCFPMCSCNVLSNLGACVSCFPHAFQHSPATSCACLDATACDKSAIRHQNCHSRQFSINYMVRMSVNTTHSS